MENSRRWFSSKIQLALIFLCLILFATGSCIFYIEEQNNFHLVTTESAYRSAQLDRGELQYYVSKYDIKSIINLRGECTGEQWYGEEKDVSRMLGVKHYDIDLSAYIKPTPDQMDRLIAIFREAKPPVLIHCRGGADRSGFASAVWKVIIDKETKSTAQKQLSIVYGHLPFGAARVLDDFFEDWQPEPLS